MSLYSGGTCKSIRSYLYYKRGRGSKRTYRRGGWRFFGLCCWCLFTAKRYGVSYWGLGLSTILFMGWGWLTHNPVCYFSRVDLYRIHTHTDTHSLSFRAEPLKAYCVKLMAYRRVFLPVVMPVCFWLGSPLISFLLVYSTRFFIFIRSPFYIHFWCWQLGVIDIGKLYRI